MDERIVEIGQQQFRKEFIEQNFAFISLVYLWFTQRAKEKDWLALNDMAVFMKAMAYYTIPILEGSEQEQDWFTTMVDKPEGNA